MVKSDSETKIVFGRPDYPLPIELRPIWRIGLICLSIQVAGSGTSVRKIKLDKLRVLLWMLIRPQKWDEYHDVLNMYSNEFTSIAIDSLTDKAIDIALVKEFIKFSNGTVSLGMAGDKLLTLIEKVSMYEKEKDFLLSVKSKMTEKNMKRILEG